MRASSRSIVVLPTPGRPSSRMLRPSSARSWITAAELRYGAAKSVAPKKNHELVAKFLATLPVLGLDAASAEIFGEAKALIEKQGQRLADADLLIGAIAATHGAVIVTGNRKHYSRIPGVALEDWIRS